MIEPENKKDDLTTGFFTNDSLQWMLKDNTEEDFTSNNKNINGLVKMTNHFGDPSHKAEARGFKDAMLKIEAIRNDNGPNPISKLNWKDLKDKINTLVRKFNKNSNENNK